MCMVKFGFSVRLLVSVLVVVCHEGEVPDGGRETCDPKVGRCSCESVPALVRLVDRWVLAPAVLLSVVR